MTSLLVTNAENEFVGKLIESLAVKHRIAVSAMPSVDDVPPLPDEVVVVEAPGDQTHVLLTMPTDDHAGQRALEVLGTLHEDMHVLFIANRLDPDHDEVIAGIKASGKPWTIIHPVEMMDFSFAALPPQISMAGVVFGISGRSPVGFVAASDIMRVLAAIIEGTGHAGQEYTCTGPEAIDMPSVVRALSDVLGRDLDYIDLPEDELTTLMIQYGRQDPDLVERLIMRHLRAWRDGRADLATDTVEKLTGQPPMSVREWFEAHRDDYGKGPGLAQKAAAKLVKARYRGRVLD